MSLDTTTKADPKSQTGVSPVEKLHALVGGDMTATDRMIHARMNSGVPLIPDLARHLIDSGGKRLRTHSWQFPQGGIKHGETPEQAMYRELHEEVGLHEHQVRIIARTRDWLRYEVPDHFIRRDARGHYRGQKQIWFLLQLTGHDSDLNLRATDHPEFDAWRWNDYWVPLEVVIEFKRGVYEMALTELSRFLPRSGHHNRYLRAGMRTAAAMIRHEDEAPRDGDEPRAG